NSASFPGNSGFFSPARHSNALGKQNTITVSICNTPQHLLMSDNY
ncbi:6188_t:CDS:1, partial [Dentiscutata erythropus]